MLSIGSQQILPRVEAAGQWSGARSGQGAGKPGGVALMLGAFRAAEVTDKQTDAQRGRHSPRLAHQCRECHEGKWPTHSVGDDIHQVFPDVEETV